MAVPYYPFNWACKKSFYLYLEIYEGKPFRKYTTMKAATVSYSLQRRGLQKGFLAPRDVQNFSLLRLQLLVRMKNFKLTRWISKNGNTHIDCRKSKKRITGVEKTWYEMGGTFWQNGGTIITTNPKLHSSLCAQPGTVRLQRGETVVHKDFVSMPSSLRGLS